MKFLVASLFMVSFGASAAQRPLCAGNRELAKAAILKSVNQRFGGPCKLIGLKKNMHWPAKGIEGYGAKAHCPNVPERSVSASVKKTDKVCAVTRITLHALSGSQCGLTDQWGGGTNDDGDPVGPQWKFDEAAEISIGDLTVAQAKALPQIIQLQLIASFDDVSTIEEALETVKEGSEAGEGYYKRFEFEGRQYDVVEFYPGGNAYGKIFEHGSSSPIASEGDGDISCVE